MGYRGAWYGGLGGSMVWGYRGHGTGYREHGMRV